MAEENFKDHWKPGVYKCAGCQRRLFSSNAKFDAKTEWPSFRKAIANGVKTRLEYGSPIKKVKVLCAECETHIGYLFEDGKTCGDNHPEAGKRYSILSEKLTFDKV